MGVLLYSQKEPENRGIGYPSLSVSPFQLVGCACAPFLCSGYVVRGAHPTLLIRFFTHHSSLITHHSVLFFPRQELPHSIHQRLLIVNAIECRGHAHGVAKEEAFI